MTTLSDKDRLDLHELCNALTDGVITEEDRARLSALLKTSEEARRLYVQTMALSASLFQYAGEMLAEAPERSVYVPASPVVRPVFWRLILPLAAAALVALGFWMGGKEGGPLPAGPAADPETEDSVAHLSGAKSCRWNGRAPALGDELRPGQRLDLVEGLAEITFDSGAQATLEAPASVEIGSAWNAVLRRGTLKVNVPAQAVGFRVANPAVDVVDLGTEFSMVADDAGGTEVLVLKGAVEATSREAAGNGDAPVVLREKQGRRFARSGSSDLKDRELKLARFSRKLALESAVKPVGYAYWSFDDLSGASAPSQVFGLPSGAAEAKLLSDEPLAGAHTDGRWNGALNLDGKRTLQAAFPGLSQRGARTVAFWARIAPDTELSDARPMIAWTLGGIETRPVEIAWNRNPAQGAFGALETRIGRRMAVGTTPLRDGRWHHLAVVMASHWRNENAFQVKLYVDGRLDSITARYGIKRRNPPIRHSDELPGIPLDVLSIGGVGNSHAGFRGDLDELYICDRALAPREIAHLMQTNQPAVPELVALE